jgi:hypothetical protein
MSKHCTCDRAMAGIVAPIGAGSSTFMELIIGAIVRFICSSTALEEDTRSSK